MTNLCHHWRCAIKRTFWPCKHGINISPGGIVTHQTLLVSSTHTGNVYRCTIKCKRCQIVVVRFEGTIEERKQLILDENVDETLMRKLESLRTTKSVHIWLGPKGPNWMADFDKPPK